MSVRKSSRRSGRSLWAGFAAGLGSLAMLASGAAVALANPADPAGELEAATTAQSGDSAETVVEESTDESLESLDEGAEFGYVAQEAAESAAVDAVDEAVALTSGPTVFATNAGCMPSNPGEWSFGKPSDTVYYKDTRVNTYVNGNATYRNHEAEGVQIVNGKTTVSKQMNNFAFNMGMTVVGSQNRPPAGSLMFATNGPMTITPNGQNVPVTVFMGLAPSFVSGMVLGSYSLANGTVPQNPQSSGTWGVRNGVISSPTYSVAKPYELQTRTDGKTNFKAQLDTTQALLDDVAATGTVAFQSGGKMVLTGTGSDTLEKFVIDGTKLQSVTNIHLVNVKKTATLVLNVTGSSIQLFQNYHGATGANKAPVSNGYTLSGEFGWFTPWSSAQIPAKNANGQPATGANLVPNAQYGADWAALTQHVLWYFPQASNVKIGVNPEPVGSFNSAGITNKFVPHGQFLGSIFIPKGNLESNFSTNGRVYVGGNYTQWGGDPSDKTGRAEGHSFPLILPGYECSDEHFGSFAVGKKVDGSGAPVDAAFANTKFKVKATWEGGQSDLLLNSNGELAAGPLNLKPGTKVTLKEDGVVGAPEHWEFKGFAFSGAGGNTNPDGTYTFTIVKDQVVQVTLTNKYQQFGTFSLKKVVSGVNQGELSAGTEFTIIASWVDANGNNQSKELTIPADGTLVSFGQELPVGTKVSFSEPDPTEIPGYTWEDLTWTGVDFDEDGNPYLTISGDRDPVATVTVTNAYRELLGGFSLEKALSGVEQGQFPEGTVFEVTASWTAKGVDHSEVFKLSVDGTVVEGPQDIPEGTVVTFSELTVPELEGYVWEGVAFSPESVTVGDRENVKVTATNTYRELLGGFSLQKSLQGIKPGKFPAGTVFDVTAKWSVDGEEFTQVFKLPVDGTVVEGPQDLPEGTVVTFTEAKAPTVKGYTWEKVTFIPQSVTIGDGENLRIVAKNTYSPDLVVTGARGTAAIVLGGLVLLAGGVGAFAFSRRRTA